MAVSEGRSSCIKGRRWKLSCTGRKNAEQFDEGKKNAIKAGNLSLKGTMITLFFRGLHMISVIFKMYPAG